MKRMPVMLASVWVAVLVLLSPLVAQAEDKTFSEAELDQMMAPIALYPDSLLAQILMAATYPADVAEAVTWSEKNPDQNGDAAVQAVQDKNWDPSVMSLVAFPQVLTMAGEYPDWVQNLGDAFLADSDAVMDTVQTLRNKAREEGNLETTDEQKVIVEEPSSSETVVIIEPADPQVVYVPTYNPTVVYGTWWWPSYRPWYWYPPGYGFGSAVWRGIGFGIGIGITNSLWGGCRWGRGNNSVDINVNRYNNINIDRNKLDVNNKTSNWNHNAENRRGVPYRDEKSREKFDNKRGGAEQRKDFRGRDGDRDAQRDKARQDGGRDAQRDKARQTLDQRGVDPAEGRKELQGAGGDRARDSVSKANRDVAQGKLGDLDTGKARDRDAAGGMNRDQGAARDKAGSASRDAGKARDAGASRDLGGSQSRSRDNALKGSGNAQQTRQSINRGNTSNRSMNRGGGGGRGGGGRR